MAQARSRQRPSYGVIFWIVFILFVAILYMVNHNRIRAVLEETQFVDVVFDNGSDGEPRREREPVADEPELPAPTEPTSAPDVEAEPPVEVAPDVSEPGESADTTDVEIVVAPVERSTDEPASDGAGRTVTLFLIRVTDDGEIVPEAVQRTLPADQSPLTRSIEALIAGPTTSDLNRGLLTLVPPGTQLLSARVANRVAYLDFNEAFRFNPMGLEGSLGQLLQVVMTATSFPTVDRVQILIEGSYAEYLGGDGVSISQPLAPSDLSS